MRPASHRDQCPPHGCFDCAFCVHVEFKGDLLCFHGECRQPARNRGGWQLVELLGVNVSTLDPGDICDEWLPAPTT